MKAIRFCGAFFGKAGALAAATSLAVVAAALVCAPSASAIGYAYGGAFGGAGAGLGQFADPNRIAVDSTTGNVFVADTGNNRVQAFAPGDCAPVCATPLLSFAVTAPLGIAVDSSTGEVYTTRAGVNEVQSVAIAGASSGSYTLTFGGQTATLAFGANAAAVQAALEALPTIGAGNVTVTGSAGNTTLRTRVVTFTGALASTDVALLSADASGLNGGATVTPTPTTAGAPGSVSKFAPDDHLAPVSYGPAALFSSPAVTGIAPSGGVSQIAPAFGGIAVDPDGGDLLLTLGRSVGRFSSAGIAEGSPFDGTPGTTAFNTAADVAVDAAGDLIVADVVSATSVRILRFGPGGALEATLTPAPANPSAAGRRIAVAADALNGTAWATSSPTAVAGGVRLCQYEADTQTDCLATPTVSSLAYVRGLAASGTQPARLYTVAFDNSGGSGLFPGPPTIHVFVESSPPEAAIDPVDVETVAGTTAELSGTVDPNSATVAACRFEVVTAAQHAVDGFSFAQHFACDSTPSGNEPVPVAAVATDLEPATAYRVRLFASTTDGRTSTSEIEDFATDSVAPAVVTDPATFLTDRGSILRGRVNPRNTSTAYRFEYTDADDFAENEFDNAVSVPVPDGDAGAGGVDVAVEREVVGLGPDTTYFFRLVAENDEAMSAEGEARSFTTFATAAALQPPRAFELVSQRDTNGINAIVKQVSPDGERVAYQVVTPIPGTESSAFKTELVATRDAANGTWRQWEATLPRDSATLQPASAPEYPRELSRAILGTTMAFDPDDENSTNPEDASQDGMDTYWRPIGGDPVWISRDPRLAPGAPQTDPLPADFNDGPHGMSDDGSTVAFATRRPLLDEHPAGSTFPQLYVWRDGELEFAAVRPDGTVAAQTSRLGTTGSDVIENAVSKDGSRLAFSTRRVGANVDGLFVRVDGEGSVEVSLGQDVPPLSVSEPQNLIYQGADAEMRWVFFTSATRLTPDSGGSQTSNDHSDLYLYDVESETLRNLTPRMDGVSDPLIAPATADRARVVKMLGSSEDGRKVYLIADGRLPAEPSPTGASPASVGRNLYLFELGDDGEPARTRFVASLAASDINLIATGPFGERQMAVSPDGSELAFASAQPLTSAPTAGSRQVYLFDAESNSLFCPSCRSGGLPTTEPAELFRVIDGNNVRPRAISTDGTVFFETPTRLEPEDGNGALDVYEFNRGSRRLVSAGASASPSRFTGASRDGSSVFFDTPDVLDPNDFQPGVIKVYAARVGGGFGGPPTPEPPCEGDACQGPPTTAPAAPTFGSTALRGAGNVAEAQTGERCARLQRGADGAARKAASARRRARGAPPGSAKRRLSREARRLTRAAKQKKQKARACRIPSRRTK